MAFEIMHPRAAGGGNRGQRFMKKVHDLIEKIPPMEQLRSEEMSLVQLIIPSESAHRTVTYLGDLGLLQFKDLNSDKSPFQRTYAAQVKRCNEISRKLGFFKDQLDKVGIPIPSDSMEQGINFEYLENQLADYESELQEIIVNGEKLQHSYNELSEFKLVLQKVGTFLSTSQSNGRASEIQLEENSNAEEDLADTSPLLQKEPTEVSIKGRLGYICGLVPKAKVIQFERILFRATRGNILFKQAAVEQVNDPIMCEMVEKVVFVVLFAGDHAKQKILKICDAFGANRYPFPEDSERQRTIKAEVTGRLADYQSTIDAGLRHRNDVLSTISYNYEMWNSTVLKEKAIYHTLNKLNVDVTKKCLVGEAWCPSSAKVQIQDALHRAALDSRSQMSTIFHPLHSAEAPPTYFKTNKFNVAFQEIVDAYGVAKYQEANPAVYMIITFPFLFAVMFGDWGHGLCLLISTLVLILREKQLARQKLGDIMQMAFAGRYVLLLMALFSIYCGLIYNEFFSVPFYIFGPSAYKCRDLSCSDATKVGLIKYRSPYPFGVDPKWRGSRTELPFLNSLKMKMSILLGVSQMNLGVILSYCNAKFFRSPLNIRYQFIPQMIFLNSLFGYLALLIIIKWCSGSKADLYHVMIYMFLSPTDDLGENQLFWGQKVFQILLVLLAVIAVPWMLFPKPFLLRKQHRQRFEGRAYGILGSSDTESVDTEHDYSPVHEEFNFSEIFVHQMIHTIEFVLGAVSNTASYLRLWALSLAHSELSAVFYEKVLQPSWRSDSAIVKIIGFVVFAFATTMVLLVMETLSAFLHALRLHWVEFQNKFYEGDGYKFQPFSFTTIHEETD